MEEHRDSPGIEPDRTVGLGSPTPRQLPGPVEAQAPRRVALPRLIATVGASLGLLLVALLVLGWSVRRLVDWVDSRPEQRIAFSKIELVPPPPPWFASGAAGLLERVRREAKLGEELPLLALDLDALRVDFKRCPWVRDVTRVERSHGRLAVHLAYRKPVAVIVIEKGQAKVHYVVDEEGVPLEGTDFNWTSKLPPYRIRGVDHPLIKILGVSGGEEPRFGVPWRRAGPVGTLDDRDATVLGAARLAGFLQGRSRLTPMGHPAPDFVSIWLPGEPTGPLFLLDSGENWVRWGQAPGSERPGDLSAEDRWVRLLDWVDRHGPLAAKYPDYLQFNSAGMELFRGHQPGKRPSSPR